MLAQDHRKARHCYFRGGHGRIDSQGAVHDKRVPLLQLSCVLQTVQRLFLLFVVEGSGQLIVDEQRRAVHAALHLCHLYLHAGFWVV